MALTRVQAGSKANTGAVTSDTIVLTSVTAGNMLYVAFRFGQGSATLSVSDDKSNTWVREDSVDDGSRVFATFRAYNVASGTTTITISESGSPAANSMHAVAIEYSGELTSSDPFDSAITARTATSAGSTTPSVTGSGTTAQAAETLITAVGTGGTGAAFTAGTGYSFNTADTNTGNNTSPRVVVETKGLSSTTASPVGDGTLGSSLAWIAIIGAYKEAGGGGGGGLPFFMQEMNLMVGGVTAKSGNFQ